MGRNGRLAFACRILNHCSVVWLAGQHSYYEYTHTLTNTDSRPGGVRGTAWEPLERLWEEAVRVYRYGMSKPAGCRARPCLFLLKELLFARLLRPGPCTSVPSST
jgi:hypothetical protein